MDDKHVFYGLINRSKTVSVCRRSKIALFSFWTGVYSIWTNLVILDIRTWRFEVFIFKSYVLNFKSRSINFLFIFDEKKSMFNVYIGKKIDYQRCSHFNMRSSRFIHWFLWAHYRIRRSVYFAQLSYGRCVLLLDGRIAWGHDWLSFFKLWFNEQDSFFYPRHQSLLPGGWNNWLRTDRQTNRRGTDGQTDGRTDGSTDRHTL